MLPWNVQTSDRREKKKGLKGRTERYQREKLRDILQQTWEERNTDTHMSKHKQTKIIICKQSHCLLKRTVVIVKGKKGTERHLNIQRCQSRHLCEATQTVCVCVRVCGLTACWQLVLSAGAKLPQLFFPSLSFPFATYRTQHSGLFGNYKPSKPSFLHSQRQQELWRYVTGLHGSAVVSNVTSYQERSWVRTNLAFRVHPVDVWVTSRCSGFCPKNLETERRCRRDSSWSSVMDWKTTTVHVGPIHLNPLV